jgi:hypothetical protein
MPDAQRAVMAQEVRQAVSFVAEAEEAEHVAGRVVTRRKFFIYEAKAGGFAAEQM